MMYVPLTKGKKSRIDDVDSDLLKHKWQYVSSSGCAARREGPRTDYRHVWMHRVILERKIGRSLRSNEEVDHINRDKLDNRRSNLRPATRSLNNANLRLLRNNNTSGFRGVSWQRNYGKWYAYVNYEGVRYNLGYYDSKIDAAKAYNRKAKELFGEFATLNPV